MILYFYLKPFSYLFEFNDIVSRFHLHFYALIVPVDLIEIHEYNFKEKDSRSKHFMPDISCILHL